MDIVTAGMLITLAVLAGLLMVSGSVWRRVYEVWDGFIERVWRS